MLTLVEAAKLQTGDIVRRAVIETFAQSSDILRVLPFTDIAGNAMKYNREETLPGVAFRGVNESFSEGTGILNPLTESLYIAGGDLDVDKFIIDTQGDGVRGTHEAMKIKALALDWTEKFVKGDTGTDPRQFDGLQNRITGAQLIPAGSTSGGDALSLAKLDEVIDAAQDATHLLMNKTMRRRLTQAARNTSVGGFITWEKDEFGQRITHYNDLPILIADENASAGQILPFTEANPGGGTAASSSIYCLAMGDGMLEGIQNGTIDARDMGELETKPAFRTRVEWYASFAVFHGKAASRLNGIKDAAVTV